MRIKEQFNRYAYSYSKHNHIQKIGVEILAKEICSANSIADLGCGDGALYRELAKNSAKFKEFYAVDFAPSMLELHPKSNNIKEIYGDFNSKKLFTKLEKYSIDTIASASALQWAKDINFTLNQSAKVAKSGAFFIFTSNTFKTIHKTININSPIHNEDIIIEAFESSYRVKKIEKYNFELEFPSTLDMLYYIKNGGVSGGLNIGYKQIKELIKNYPLKYLEFETLLLTGDSKCQS